MKVAAKLTAVAFLSVLLVLPLTAGDAKVLMEADREFARVTAEKGIEGFASFMAEDVWLVNRGSSFIKGKMAAIDTWRSLLDDPNLSITWEPVRGLLAESGELGYTTGVYVIRGKDEEGNPLEQHGKYITIWQKQADGSWKVILDGGNTNPPPDDESM